MTNDQLIVDDRDAIEVNKLTNKNIRTIIIAAENHTPRCIQLWKRKMDLDISPYFGIAIRATKETKLRAMYFKILHGVYPTNILLSKMKVKENEKCDSCQEVDTLQHFFYECQAVEQLWIKIESLLFNISGTITRLNSERALFGLTTEQIANLGKLNEANLLILLGKLCIIKKKFSLENHNLNLILEQEMMLRKKHFRFLDID